jgi:hypothetical protein
MSTLNPQLEALEQRVLPSSVGSNVPPVVLIQAPTQTPATTPTGQPTVVFGSGAGQAFGFPSTAAAAGQSIESLNQGYEDDTFQGPNLNVFDGPSGPLAARIATFAQASVASTSAGSTSVGKTGVAAQAGNQFDPYKYSPLSGSNIVGADEEPVPPPEDSLVPLEPNLPAGSARGADSALEPSRIVAPAPAEP